MQRHFDEELLELKGELLRMASLAEESIAKAVKALVERDGRLAQNVIDSDEEINMLEIEIDEICLKLLALRQPIAKDLRLITSAMKINSDLERIGDLSVNIAQRTLDLLEEPLLKPLLDISRMAKLAQKMVKDSLDAFVRQDAGLAREVCRRDDIVDMLNHQIFRELLTYMLQDPRNIHRSVDLILIGRHLERIADHATNIGEDVFYMVQGRTIKHHIEEKMAESKK
ncbi:MAG: phosphate signaling complex protein PhoU [Candidatus Omnitrophica bacterium]|nr:phosphate signaling complex protein PhoU [Candidatus Omnitrophota bacterium]MDD5672278.1 phosphate signaling complex protein PhoU [Candidatus Omnitrophota bacterium]